MVEVVPVVVIIVVVHVGQQCSSRNNVTHSAKCPLMRYCNVVVVVVVAAGGESNGGCDGDGDRKVL